MRRVKITYSIFRENPFDAKQGPEVIGACIALLPLLYFTTFLALLVGTTKAKEKARRTGQWIFKFILQIAVHFTRHTRHRTRVDLRMSIYSAVFRISAPTIFWGYCTDTDSFVVHLRIVK